MKGRSKRRIGTLLSAVMLTGTVLSGVQPAFAAEKAKIDVWDFGGVEEDVSAYENHITTAVLDSMTAVGDEASGSKGKFIDGGTFDMGGGLSLTTNANDRIFYNGADGLRSYGSNAKAESAYEDGYTANGMWYANGTGDDTKRFVSIESVNAGDGIAVYAGASNTTDTTVYFEYMGTDAQQKDSSTAAGGEVCKSSFAAKYTGTYKIWFDPNGGKPVINRIVRYPAAAVSGSISNLASAPSVPYTVVFRNTSTGDRFSADIPAGTSTFAVALTPGYVYSAVLRGIDGYGFTSEAKSIEVPVGAAGASVAAELKIEPKPTYTVTGSIKGFDTSYDISGLKLVFTPDSEDVQTVEAVLNGTAYSAVFEPDAVYTAGLEGVNDYEISSGGKVANDPASAVRQQDIQVVKRPVYTVKGSFVTSDGGAADVSRLTFTNTEDNYIYEARVYGGSYTVSLRDGEYSAEAVSDTYGTTAHASVRGGAVEKDIYLKSKSPAPPAVDTSSRDIYVGIDAEKNSYKTLGEAFAAAAVINPRRESERVTIHIAPGIYREQTSLNTPYVSLVKEGSGDAVITWYYGIGYNYYSAAADGWYSDEAAFDSYNKGGAEKWGTAVYIKSGAKYFRAEGITFEASFNKYVTDEEVADGVESDGSMAFLRNPGSNVTSKEATERSTALSVEADNAEFKDCRFIGSQDTLYMGAPIRVYYKNCVIEGNTDYIFGSGNAVFDGCELRFNGYSDRASGGYITAARNDKDRWTGSKLAYKGYLFRNCIITNKASDGFGREMLHEPGYFGRPWDQNAAVTFVNTLLERQDAIKAEGWTEMSGSKPQLANFKEYNTTYSGTAADVSGRVEGTVMSAEDAASVRTESYFGSWKPAFLGRSSGTPSFETEPFFSDDGDVLLPASGDTLTVKYSLGINDDADVSKIEWYRVSEDKKTQTLIKTSGAAAENGAVYRLTSDDIGCFVKAVVTPVLLGGKEGEPMETVTVKTVAQGDGGGVVSPRPSGKTAIFLAGDSTLKDYSAGALNNGTQRTEGSWGEFLGMFMNGNYVVRDYAEGGRSSRTFIDGDGTKTDGSDRFLDKIKAEMVKGDYLFIQFGHNDSSEDYKDRYVPVGKTDAKGIYPTTPPTSEGAGDGTFKWYLNEMIKAAKEAGATPVVVTPVSRMYFNSDGTIRSHHGSNDEYVEASKQIASENGIECIDLYAYTKELYEKAYKDGRGTAKPEALFAVGENTHHSKVGGLVIAAHMAYELKNNAKIGLQDAVSLPAAAVSADAEGHIEFEVLSDGTVAAYGKNADGVYDKSVKDSYWTAYIKSEINALKNK